VHGDEERENVPIKEHRLHAELASHAEEEDKEKVQASYKKRALLCCTREAHIHTHEAVIGTGGFGQVKPGCYVPVFSMLNQEDRV